MVSRTSCSSNVGRRIQADESFHRHARLEVLQPPCHVVEKAADADLLREMIGFVGERLMELGVGGLTGAAWARRAPRSGDRVTGTYSFGAGFGRMEGEVVGDTLLYSWTLGPTAGTAGSCSTTARIAAVGA